jgi:hypothetical protein
MPALIERIVKQEAGDHEQKTADKHFSAAILYEVLAVES